MMPLEQTTQQRKNDIKESAMASLVKVPLVGSLINKLSEYVVEKQSLDTASSNNQVALIEKQNVILQTMSKDTSTMLRGMMMQIGVLNDIKKTNKERDRQAFLDKQRQAALEEEASLEAKKDAVTVATKEVANQKEDKTSSLFGLLGTLLKSIASLAAALIALPSKIASAFKALLSLKNAISMLPQIARFFTLNPILLAGVAGAALITLLARDKNPDETSKSIINAGTPDTAMAEAITKTAEAPDAEKQAKKQNLLANRPKEKKSMLFWKDTELQQDYLKEIGWDEKTGTTSEERNRAGRIDVRKMDNQAEAAQPKPSPQESTSTALTPKLESVDAQPMSMRPTIDQTEPSVVPSQPNPTSGQNISQASAAVESMYTSPVSNKQGGVMINTNNSMASSTPKQRSPIPSPVANRGSIDNFAFSAI